MRRSSARVAAGIVILAMTWTWGKQAQANAFIFKVLAATGDTIEGKTLTGFLSQAPVLNDNGEVVFGGIFSGGMGIFTPNNLLAASGAIIDGKTLGTNVDGIGLNNHGDVVFAYEYSDSQVRGAGGVFTPSKAIAVKGNVIAGVTLGNAGGETLPINDNREVTFVADFTPGGGGPIQSGLFTPSSLLVTSGEIISSKMLSCCRGPSLNNNGDVVFHAEFPGGLGIFTPSAFLAGTGDIIDGKTLTILGFPWINDHGDVIFFSEFPGGGGIFTPQHLLVSTGDIIDGKTLTNISRRPQFNNIGEVAFGGLFAGGSGVFLLHELIAGTGDVIDGKTIADISALSLNNHGDVAFTASFQDGSNALILAQVASPIPEPSTWLLIMTGLVSLLGYAWRRNT